MCCGWRLKALTSSNCCDSAFFLCEFFLQFFKQLFLKMVVKIMFCIFMSSLQFAIHSVSLLGSFWMSLFEINYQRQLIINVFFRQLVAIVVGFFILWTPSVFLKTKSYVSLTFLSGFKCHSGLLYGIENGQKLLIYKLNIFIA